MQDSLTARLDRLAPVKEVAQVAACIGRGFSYELLAAVSPPPEAALQDALRQLADSGLIFAQGSPPDASYTFKHALVQDAAYGSLLKSRRVELHARIAATLEATFPEVAATQPEIVAHHYTQAGLTKQAIGYWHKAGLRASQRLAYTEAIAYFQRGIELAGALPEGEERAALELGLQIGLGYAFIPTKGFTAPESARAFTRAQALCQYAADDASLFSAMWGLFVFSNVSGETLATDDFASRCLALAERTGSSDLLVEAHLARGLSAQRSGRFGPARADLEKVAVLYDPVAHRDHALIYGQDPKVLGSSWLALILWALGYPDQALTCCAEAEAATQEISHPFSQCFAPQAASMLHQLRREPEAAEKYANALIAVAADQGFPFFTTVGAAYRSLSLIQQGRGGSQELAQLQGVVDTMRATGALEPALRVQTFLAQAYLHLGNIPDALEASEEGLRLTRQQAQVEFEAFFLRLLGDVLLAHPNGAEIEAENFYRESIDVARRQEAKSLELQAALGLARVWSRQRKRKPAMELLQPVYDWFTEGFDTQDLKDAKALLEELGT